MCIRDRNYTFEAWGNEEDGYQYSTPEGTFPLDKKTYDKWMENQLAKKKRMKELENTTEGGLFPNEVQEAFIGGPGTATVGEPYVLGGKANIVDSLMNRFKGGA